MLSTITPMNRFSTTKVAMMVKGKKNSQAQGLASIALRTTLPKSSIAISWNSVKKAEPRSPNSSSITPPNSFTAITAKT